MGWLARMGFAVSALIATCAGGPPPETDAARVERIDEMYRDLRHRVPQAVPTMTAAELLAARRAGAELVLVDTRTEAERTVSTIPGAIASSVVEQDPAAYSGKTLVAYCTIGYRSGLWAEKMNRRGLSVRNLEGSLLMWTHVGGPLQTPQGADTKQLHVYGRPWDLAKTDYTAVW